MSVQTGSLSYDEYLDMIGAAIKMDMALARLCRDRKFTDAFRVVTARARTMKAESDTAQ